MEVLTRRTTQLLKTLYERGIATYTYSLCMKQNDLAKQLGISRQALNVHLRKLRNVNYVRTGRGFIDVTEKGLNALGTSSNPAFVFIKVSPHRRSEVYKKIKELTIQKAFRIAGDVDALIMVERTKLDEILSKLSYIEGVKDTKSYVAIEPIK
ncbi:winged helix-turn-helix transcriptional regulator [Candidatus Bathyarchaeota archaeon]|nr:winged helix-turn-helix transcriptional regulator [Candidatus Bathyarchaeota archaeon]MCK4434715.1 winged helix-turn-helix transcriptional regulator [Candidatus Bathyarchaeota archaeon]MCK4668830.1 winged helix-turn-helix transcriptional regulator [Candidatus Bathyarchaeota archaeon]